MGEFEKLYQVLNNEEQLGTIRYSNTVGSIFYHNRKHELNNGIGEMITCSVGTLRAHEKGKFPRSCLEGYARSHKIAIVSKPQCNVFYNIKHLNVLFKEEKPQSQVHTCFEPGQHLVTY